jgi:hypothetical protein
MNKMQDRAFEVLNSMQNGTLGDDIKPGLSSYTASMLAAMHNNDWKQVLHINDLMVESAIQPSSTTFQCVLLANMRQGDIEGSIEAMEESINSNFPIDKDTFRLCTKNLLPNHCGDGDFDVMRKEMRELATSTGTSTSTISPKASEKAMDLNKTLRECLREDERRPSNVKSEIVIQRERERLWRLALHQAIQLSRAM